MTLDSARRASGSHPAAPGRMLLHPVAIAALVILIVNDHLLKSAFPGAVTGKLSDVAGLVVFPLLLATAFEVVSPRTDRRALILVSIGITVVGVTAVKTTALGASLFGWGLGLGQWILTLGPLRDAQPSPAAVIVDPTDLFALPAVLVAGWVALPRRFAPPAGLPNVRTRPSAAGLAILIIAGVATMATSPARPSVGTDFEADLHLTKDAPVAVRHLDFTLVPGKDHIQAVTLTGDVYEHVTEDGMEFLASSGNARLSIIPDPTDVKIPVDASFMAPAFDLTELCVAGCSHGVTLIVRLAPGAPESLDVVLNASMFATDDFREGQDQEMDAVLTLLEDVDARIDGAPPSVLAIASGSIEVGSADSEQRTTVKLTVDGAALKRPLTFPLAGRLTVNMIAESASYNPYAANVSLTLQDDPEPIILSGDAVPVDLDWLSHCKPATDCTITLDIDMSYAPWMNAPEPDATYPGAESAPGYVRMTWTVEARLEAFDGRELPANALVLTEP